MDNYIPVKSKLLISLIFSLLWMAFSVYISRYWYYDLSVHIGKILAFYLIGFIAILPGFINMFVFFSLLFDRRPGIKSITTYPNVTILMSAYNEESHIQSTIKSIFNQNYPGIINLIVINDGSTDATVTKVEELQIQYPTIKLINLKENIGKARALNEGLKIVETEIVITIDADCWLKDNSIKNIVARYLSDPSNTKAIAGTILIKNSRDNWITKAQEWDYFLGIGAVKRIQSLYQGTLVAQGAFSLYDKTALLSVGGWPNRVGEDIVLSWKLLKQGWRIGHAENACVFTNCPNTLWGFVKQRQRWSRGLIEAFKENPQLIYTFRLNTIFIWWNLLFPLIDIAYTFGFLPGIILALFGKFWIIGPMTLALIPPSILFNSLMYSGAKKMFNTENLYIRNNTFGLVFFMFAYGLILQPACVIGYLSELFGLKKTWGTK